VCDNYINICWTASELRLLIGWTLLNLSANKIAFQLKAEHSRTGYADMLLGPMTLTLIRWLCWRRRQSLRAQASMPASC